MEPVTVVFARRVKPEHIDEYRELSQQVVNDSHRFEGHLSSTILNEPGSPDFEIIYTFSDGNYLQKWLDSDERMAFRRAADPLSDKFERLTPFTGLETWFKLPHRETIKPPPRWKMWLVSVVSVYPLIVVMQAWVFPELEKLPLLIRAAILPLVMVSLMTFVLLPLASRLLKGWLFRE